MIFLMPLYFLVVLYILGYKNKFMRRFETLCEAITFNIIVEALILFIIALLLAFLQQLYWPNIIILHFIITFALRRYLNKIAKDDPHIKRKQPLWNQKDAFLLLVVLVLFIGTINPSSFIAPVQNDANSYATLGVIINKIHGIRFEGAIDLQAAKSIGIDNAVTFNKQLVNLDTTTYSIVGMPLFPIVLAIIPLFSSFLFLKYAGFILGALAVCAFSLFMRHMVKYNFAYAISLLMFAFNAAQDILVKKTYNESLAQFLLLAFVYINIDPRLNKVRPILSLLALALFVSTRAELLIVVGIYIFYLALQKQWKQILATAIVAGITTGLNIYMNEAYYQNEIFKRIGNVLAKYFTSIYSVAIIASAVAGVIVLLIIIGIAGFFIIKALTKKAIHIQLPIREALIILIWVVFALNIIRVTDFFRASNFSFDERLIALYPVEFVNFENIILLRLGILITTIVIVFSLVGLSLYIYQRRTVHLVSLITTFYFVIFFTTSQHDPNIVPWSRRYILFVIPAFAIFFGYLIYHMLRLRIMTPMLVKSAALAITSLIIIKGLFFIQNGEYTNVEATLQVMASDEHIKKGIVLFDVNADRGTIDNTKFCEPLNLVYNIKCYYVPRLDLNFSDGIRNTPVYIISTRGNLEKDRYELLKRYDTVMDAFGNSFYSVPESKRSNTSTAYLYHLRASADEIPDTNEKANTNR